MNYVGIGLIGLVSGIISGLLGVGGGIVMVPAMILILKLEPKQAIGTSLAVIIPTALMGTFKHASMGNVNWKAGLILAPLAIVGGYVGAHLTRDIPGDMLKRIFGGFLIAVGAYMTFSGQK